MTETRKLVWRYVLYSLFAISIFIAGWGIMQSLDDLNSYANGDGVKLEFVTMDIPYGGVLNWDKIIKTKGFSIVSGEIDTGKYGKQTIVLKISDFSRIFQQEYTFNVVDPSELDPKLLPLFSM